MTIQEQILKQIELEARRNGLNSQIRSKEVEISKAITLIKETEDEKSENISAYDEAVQNINEVEKQVETAKKQVETASEAVDDAKKHLKETLAVEKQAHDERDKYGGGFFTDFDVQIKKLNLDKEQLEKQKVQMGFELKSLLSEIQFLQTDLKNQGIELNINEQRQPKTSVL